MLGEEPVESRFDRWRRRCSIWAGPVGAVLVYGLARGTTLSPEGQKLAGILTLTIIYWVGEPVSLPATALLAPLLCVLVGVADAKKVFAPFAAPTIFLFLGAFLLAEAVRKHGLDRRVAMRILGWRWAMRSPRALVWTVGAATAFLSMWMSNTATAALVIPIVIGLMRAHPQLARPPLPTALLLTVAYAASIGGLGTPIGTPPNLIAMGFLEELTQRRISFVEWMMLGVPLAAAMLTVLTLWVAPRKMPGWPVVVELPVASRSGLHLSAGERNILVAFAAALGGWLWPGLVQAVAGPDGPGVAWFAAHAPEEMVGLAAGLLLFVLPVNWRAREFTIGWKDAVQIDWGTILLFGGGLSLGQLIFSTGLAKWASTAVLGGGGLPALWLVLAAGIGLSLVLTELMSNTATANVTVPLLIGLAQTAQLDPAPVAVAACLACSLGFMLPVSTPPNAIAYSTGLVPLPQMLRAGVLLDLAGAALIWLAVWLGAPYLWR